MAFFYSTELIQEAIQCFKEEDGLDISPETANEYLEVFASLYTAFARKEQDLPFAVGHLECPTAKGKTKT